MPAERVPVVDVLFENKNVRGGDGLVLQEMRKQGVGGRATGAALGGEEFD